MFGWLFDMVEGPDPECTCPDCAEELQSIDGDDGTEPD